LKLHGNRDQRVGNRPNAVGMLSTIFRKALPVRKGSVPRRDPCPGSIRAYNISKTLQSYQVLKIPLFF